MPKTAEVRFSETLRRNNDSPERLSILRDDRVQNFVDLRILATDRNLLGTQLAPGETSTADSRRSRLSGQCTRKLKVRQLRDLCFDGELPNWLVKEIGRIPPGLRCVNIYESIGKAYLVTRRSLNERDENTANGFVLKVQVDGVGGSLGRDVFDASRQLIPIGEVEY